MVSKQHLKRPSYIQPIAQITNMIDSEKLAYRYMLEQYAAMKNTNYGEKLKKYPLLEYETAARLFFISSLRDKTIHELGVGTTHKMGSVITGIFLPVMQCKAHTLRQKITIWRAKFFLRHDTKLLNQLFSTDLPSKIPQLEVPVYFLSRIYDYTVKADF